MNNKSRNTNLVALGAELTGAIAGTAIGLFGGPAGAITGSAVGVVITKGLSEIGMRLLSNREEIRIGAAAGLSIVGIQKRIALGESPREDNFFDSDNGRRSKAEELFEGVLLKCKNEYEEKKINYLSKILENVAFDVAINPDNANQILSASHQMTYRQLVSIALIGQNIQNKFALRESDGITNTCEVKTNQLSILQDFVILERLGVVQRIDNTAILDISDIAPGLISLSALGVQYFQLLSLSQMPETEFTFIEALQ